MPIHERHTQRERRRCRQREKQAPCREPDGTRSRVSRIRPWTEGGAKPLSHRGCPRCRLFKFYFNCVIIFNAHRDKQRERDDFYSTKYIFRKSLKCSFYFEVVYSAQILPWALCHWCTSLSLLDLGAGEGPRKATTWVCHTIFSLCGQSSATQNTMAWEHTK